MSDSLLTKLAPPHTPPIVIVAVVCAIMSMAFLPTGCSTVGVANPEVRDIAYDVVDTLQAVYDNADDAEMVRLYCGLSLSRALRLYGVTDSLSDIDNEKATRLVNGIQKIHARADNEDYVRVRSKSLLQLAATIGLYDNEGWEEADRMIREATGNEQPQTQTSSPDEENHGESEDNQPASD